MSQQHKSKVPKFALLTCKANTDGTTCVPCGVGLYSDSTTQACESCPPGTFGKGDFGCTNCDEGFYVHYNTLNITYKISHIQAVQLAILVLQEPCQLKTRTVATIAIQERMLQQARDSVHHALQDLMQM
jgi:hypothetical protein